MLTGKDRQGITVNKTLLCFNFICSRNEVLIVDASGPSLNPDTSEVSTTVHKVFSPVKVICHSPSPERQKHGYEINTLSGSYNVKVESPKQIVLGETIPIQSGKKMIKSMMFAFLCVLFLRAKTKD